MAEGAPEGENGDMTDAPENPTPAEIAKSMARAINSEKLRRELARVFQENAETVSELTSEEFLAVVYDALRED